MSWGLGWKRSSEIFHLVLHYGTEEPFENPNRTSSSSATSTSSSSSSLSSKVEQVPELGFRIELDWTAGEDEDQVALRLQSQLMVALPLPQDSVVLELKEEGEDNVAVDMKVVRRREPLRAVTMSKSPGSGQQTDGIGVLTRLMRSNFSPTSGVSDGASLPADYADHWKSITVLNLSGCGLVVLPVELTRLPLLEKLCLDNNKLSVLPPELGELKSLKVLRVDYNMLVSVPVELRQCVGLVELSLEHNKLVRPLLDFRAMAELRVLRLFGNPLEFLPEILPLQNLRHLSLANIRIVADEYLRSVNVQIEVENSSYFIASRHRLSAFFSLIFRFSSCHHPLLASALAKIIQDQGNRVVVGKDKNAVRQLISMISSDNRHVVEQACSALSSLVADVSVAMQLIKADIMQPIETVLKSVALEEIKYVLQVVVHLAFASDIVAQKMLTKDVLKSLKYLCTHKNPEVQRLALSAVGNLAFCLENRRTLVTSESKLVFAEPVPKNNEAATWREKLDQLYKSSSQSFRVVVNGKLVLYRNMSLAEEELLHAIDLEAAHSNGSRKELAEEKSKSGSTSSTSEDDWVEVKVPDSPLLDSTFSSRSSKSDSHPGRSKQDLYEATAEFTDPDPCTSLILRLLSLQNKEHIYVDEVYVFADPVDSAESEDQQGRAENSAGSSLMAMLVPTLLQLSKTSNSRAADKNALEIRNEQNSQAIVPKGIELISTSNKYQLEAKSSIADQDLDRATDEPMQSHTPTQNPDIKPDSTDKEKNFTCSQSERSMDQLVSRVSRIEEILLRFEENMLKPICSIDERLQRVEQQLEVFTKNYQYSGFSSGTRFSAPDFSCTESGSNSFYNDGSDFPSCGVSGSDKRDIPYDKLTIPPNDMSASVKVTQLLPSLVVNAPPEFSNGEHDYASEPTIDSASYKPREAVSIDDALASALVGFISSTSIHRQGYTQTLAIKAPEFTNDEDDNDNIVASPRVQREMTTDKAPEFSNDEDDNDNIVASPRVQREMTTDKAPEFTNDEDDNDNIVASPRVQHEMITDKAPEFTNDEDDNDNVVASPRVQHEMTTDPSIPDKINGIECVGGALLSPCSDASFESGREKMSSLNNDYFEEVTQGVDGGGHIIEGGEGNVHCHLTPVKHGVLEDTSNTKISNGVCEILSSDNIVLLIPNQQPENQIDNISVTDTTDEVGVESPEIPTVSDRTVDTSVIRKPCTEHILQNVLESHAYPVLDFEAPILDVKFECQENSISKSPLDVLWNDTAESSIEYPPHVEATDNGTGIDELILLENGEASGATGNDLFVDMFHYELETMPSIMDVEEIQNRYSGSSQEISATSLI